MSSLTHPFRPDSIPTNLVAYWKFNEADYSASGSADSSGNGHTLTESANIASTVGDYWKTGEYSPDFVPADNCRFTATRTTSLDLLGNFSIAVWVKCGTDNTAVNICDKDQSGTGYSLFISAGQVPVLYMNNGARVTAVTTLPVGKWMHIVFTYDGVAPCVYINGNLDAVGAAYSTECTNTSTNLTIGSTGAGAADFEGKMKDFAIWNHGAGAVLTPLQIKSLALGVDLSKYAYRPNHASPAYLKANWSLAGVLTDSKGGHTLTDNGTVPFEGGYIEGQSPHFDGSVDYYSIAGDVGADFDFSGGKFSISAWIKADTVAGNDTIYTNFTDANHRFDFRLATGKLDAEVVNSGGDAVHVIGTTTLVVNTWYHVAITEDGDTWKLWLDGVDDTASGGTDTGRCEDYTGAIRIGTDYNAAGEFDGFIQDLAVWNGGALTEAEIKSLACGLPIQRQGIVSYWKMDDTSGNATDSIGSNTGVENATVGSAAGQVGTARDFEASDNPHDYFEVANNDSINITSDLSILGWVKPESAAGAGNYLSILDKSYSAGYSIYLHDAVNVIEFYVKNVTVTGTTSVGTGAFKHICGTYTGSALTTYVNGVYDNTAASTTNPTDTTSVLSIGRESTAYYDGLIDELVLAKRYFRPEEIKAAYVKGLNGKEVTDSERWPGSANVIWMT